MVSTGRSTGVEPYNKIWSNDLIYCISKIENTKYKKNRRHLLLNFFPIMTSVKNTKKHLST